MPLPPCADRLWVQMAIAGSGYLRNSRYKDTPHANESLDLQFMPIQTIQPIINIRESAFHPEESERFCLVMQSGIQRFDIAVLCRARVLSFPESGNRKALHRTVTAFNRATRLVEFQI